MDIDAQILIMKSQILVSFLFLAGMAWAQNTRGYLFVAPGGISAAGTTERAYEIGGGVERLIDRGIGAGAELEGVVPGVGRAANAVGLFSLNGYYHFLRDRRLDPFATSGYSLLFRDYTANLFNYGAGVNYWFQDNLALQVGIRDHVGSNGGITTHYWGIRVGVAFR
jgi:hypothetical protein